MKTKSQLADKFSGPSSLLYQSGILEIGNGYEAVTSTTEKNPSEEGWYEKGTGDVYSKTTDTTPVESKTYYMLVKTFTVTPELDVPCKVDSLNFEQGEADVEKYKVIGLAGAWITDSEPGEVDYSFRVPSISEDILKLAFGEDAVSAITGKVDNVDYEGLALILKNKKVQGTWLIVNSSKDRIMVINNTALFASLVLDSDAKGVLAVDFNGSIESDGTNPDIIFLKKKA